MDEDYGFGDPSEDEDPFAARLMSFEVRNLDKKPLSLFWIRLTALLAEFHCSKVVLSSNPSSPIEPS